MPQVGALLCFKGIVKGDMSNFRLITDKNLLYQLFVQNLVKILKTFHFFRNVPIWNVNGMFCSTMFPIYTQNLVAIETGIYRKFSPKVGHMKIYDQWILLVQTE